MPGAPEVLPQREPARVNLRGLRTTDVAVMPWFVLVTRDPRLAPRVRHHEAVLPAISLEPGPSLGSCPVGIEPGLRPAFALEVDRRPELMFAMPRPGAREKRSR